MSLLKLAKIINTNERSVKEFQKNKWKPSFGCVRCGSIRAWKHGRLKNGLFKYRCNDCKHVFSDQSSTLLKWNKVKLNSVAVVNKFSHSKMTVRDIAKEACINKNTVLKLKRLIRRTNSAFYLSLSPPILSGVVEMDETKICKEWFWGGLSRGRKRIVVEQVPNRNEGTLSSKIWKYAEENTTFITDEWRGYRPHPRFFKHYTVNHSKYFVSPECGLIHTNTIECLWRQVKRKINHFCNGVKLDYVQEYINEYLYLKNYDQSQKPTFFPLYCSLSHVNPTFS